VNAAAAGVLRIDLRILYNEELRDLCRSVSIIRIVKSKRLLRAARRMRLVGEMINEYTSFVGKPERKEPLGRHRRRWNYNIKMRIKENVI
jgi:hypothetical protein